MKCELFAVKDVKAGRFLPPNIFPARAVALRAYATAIADKSNPTLLSQYPEDVQIFVVGSFDDETGILQVKNPIDFVANGVDLIKKPQNSSVENNNSNPLII